jgi:hypothetical protein
MVAFAASRTCASSEGCSKKKSRSDLWRALNSLAP